jgi:aminoglycoside 6'-N-acetyltransferase
VTSVHQSPADLELRTKRLILRRFREEDLPRMMAYRNDPVVARYDGFDTITEAQARAFMAGQALIRPGEPGQWLQIALELPGEGLIGDLGFCVDENRIGSAEIGYRLAREYWGRGYASEAVGAVLGWAFDVLRLHRVVALIDTRNERSIRLVERFGFRREGTLLEAYQEPDGWSDEYLYAILEREWES